MSKLNLLNYNFTSLVMMLMSFVLIIDEVGMLSNLFYLLLLFFSIYLKNLKLRYKKLLSSIFSIGTIYILFILNDYTLSKEFFINLLLGLIFLKFSEIENTNHQYFFNFTCVFFAISSLIYGQDLISSLLSLSIVILSIIHLYSLNQTKILKLNLKNLLRYLGFALSIIPIIAIVYLVFPRTELNIKLFETKKNQLGIPDKISLGSFQDISDSDETVFIYTSNNEEVNKKIYFRVKVFDRFSNNKDWLTTDYRVLLTKFKNNFKVTQNNESKKFNSSLIMFPHEKKWIPKLSNYNYNNKNLNLNLINNTISSHKILTNKKSFNLINDKKDIQIKEEMIEYYKLLPNDISPKLKKWAENNFNKSKNKTEYLNNILNEFNTKNFFYSLTPEMSGNNYEKFFFESKTGYCEYYAGTFTILARLAGIPSRIVTGYYGGSYNDLGNFYTFKQEDAHSWSEVYINNKWIQYDPTLSVPIENIQETNNSIFENVNQENDASNETDDIKINNIGIYFEYMNYIWTNSFLRYNEKSRINFINENLKNQNNYKFLILGIILIFFAFHLLKVLSLIYTRKILYNLFFQKLQTKNKEIKYSMTHQKIYKILNEDDKSKFKYVFENYELTKFSKKSIISFNDFCNINIQILKYVYFK